MPVLPSAPGDLVRARHHLAGFAVDKDPEHLGEALRLPRQHEHLRPQLERRLTRSRTRAPLQPTGFGGYRCYLVPRAGYPDPVMENARWLAASPAP
jgi:hypothetical protein